VFYFVLYLVLKMWFRSLKCNLERQRNPRVDIPFSSISFQNQIKNVCIWFGAHDACLE